jgi:hypothetical protein
MKPEKYLNHQQIDFLNQFFTKIIIDRLGNYFNFSYRLTSPMKPEKYLNHQQIYFLNQFY